MMPDNNLHPRMKREYKTIGAMIRITCHEQHGTEDGLCAECQDLQDYAFARLAKCPFQEQKTTCANCAVHCYRKDYRARIREVMRYAGPRMIKSHPVLAILHLLDGRKKPQPLPARRPRRSATSD